MSKRLAFLEQLTASGNTDTFTWYALALEYRNAGRIEDTLRTFEAIRSREPNYVPMYLMAGQVLKEAGRSEEARAWLEQGIEQAKSKRDHHAVGEIEALLAELIT